MKLNTSYLIAGGLVILGAIWFAVNNGGDDAPLSVSTPATAKTEARRSIPTVRVKEIIAQDHPNILELYGQTRAAREVSVKAETAGLVAAINAREGAKIGKGQVLCRQGVNARQAIVDQATANLRTIESDLNAARILAEKGYQSQTRVMSFEAQLDGAKAALKQAEIELDAINIRSPFSGVWERQEAEVGDYLSPGMSCGLLVDLSPLKVDVELTEMQLALVERGMGADIILATGEQVSGKMAFIESRADPATRTFRGELHVPNEAFALRAGVTATVRLTSGLTRAQQIPGNILTLDESGSVGVRYVDANNIVRFATITTIDEDEDGQWVMGLPERTKIIIEGQNFVSVGQEVNANANYGADASYGQ